MKTIMAVLMLLISTSVLAANPNQNALDHANCHASFLNNCDTVSSAGAVDKVYSVPEPSTLSLMGLGLAATILVRARKRKI